MAAATKAVVAALLLCAAIAALFAVGTMGTDISTAMNTRILNMVENYPSLRRLQSFVDKCEGLPEGEKLACKKKKALKKEAEKEEEAEEESEEEEEAKKGECGLKTSKRECKTAGCKWKASKGKCKP